MANLTGKKTFAIIVIQTITHKQKRMREIINISLPSPMAKSVKTAVRRGRYSSTSEFFRVLLREWQAGELLNGLNESRAEILSGRGKRLKSLKNLR